MLIKRGIRWKYTREGDVLIKEEKDKEEATNGEISRREERREMIAKPGRYTKTT